MKPYWAKLLVGVVLTGFFFWAYNNANMVNGLYMEGPFTSFPDCQTVRAWVAAIPTPTPSATGTPVPSLVVSPSCYLMNAGGN
jgi:hypothetical protein